MACVIVGKYVIKNVMLELLLWRIVASLSNTRPGFHPQYHRKQNKKMQYPCEYHFGKLTVLGERAMTNPVSCGGVIEGVWIPWTDHS